jgi:hypothetical protein
MLNRWKFVISLTVASVMIAANGYAQSPILVIKDSGWANTNTQSTPPAALIMATGDCVQSSTCWLNISVMSALNPLTFYPSSHVQTVTITSSWGPTFDAYASVFAAGGNVNYAVIQVLSNDGLIPSNFFTSYQGNAGTANLKAATVTSVTVTVAPFAFQQTSGGWWVAVGNDGNPPQMNIKVSGT